MALFNRVTIVGLGLIGGSLGMAIRRRHLARTVVGYSRKPSTLRRAKQRGAIDIGTTNLRDAVREADLVVIATPVDAIVPFAQHAARFCRRGAILTDVGSTKTEIVCSLERSLPRHVSFVGAHPIAGSEQHGIGAAQATLFDGSVCVLTPTDVTPRRAQQAVARLWKRLGVQVVTMSPARHDRLFAAMSHLPHAVAFCLAGCVPKHRLPQTPPSFLCMTRIAESDPDLWDDIFLSNRRPMLAAMDQFAARWAQLRVRLARGDRRGVRAFLTDAKAQRHAIC